MNENQRDWARWGIRLVVVFLAGYLAGSLCGQALGSVVTFLAQIVGSLAQPLLYLVGLAGSFARFFAAAFVYCLLLQSNPKGAAVGAWASLLALDVLTRPSTIVTFLYPIVWIRMALDVSAVFLGARAADERRHREIPQRFIAFISDVVNALVPRQ
ncbi:MAG: hypothetical protein HY078_12980 [Elusimicrobia bacterium]|nr:hypothetical protein [Elusimicrobiota bacterium]